MEEGGGDGKEGMNEEILSFVIFSFLFFLESPVWGMKE